MNPNTAATFAANIAASLAAINVGFFQNASAFLGAPPDPKPNQWGGGPWIRIADGRNDVNAVGTTQNASGATNTNSLVRTSFNGFQTGVDLGLFNIENTGWNAHFGVTGGQVLLSANELQSGISTNEITVPFVGIYGAITGHNFFADFQVREDFYDMKVSNPVAFLNQQNLNANGISANGSIGYRYDVTSQFFVEPSLAVLYSKLNVNALQVGIDPANNSYGTLSFAPIESLMGRAGLRVGTNYSFQTIAVQPFLTGSVWHEFEGDTTSTFSATGGQCSDLRVADRDLRAGRRWRRGTSPGHRPARFRARRLSFRRKHPRLCPQRRHALSVLRGGQCDLTLSPSFGARTLHVGGGKRLYTPDP